MSSSSGVDETHLPWLNELLRTLEKALENMTAYLLHRDQLDVDVFRDLRTVQVGRAVRTHTR